jgi:hypothetical protein
MTPAIPIASSKRVAPDAIVTLGLSLTLNPAILASHAS